MKSTGYVLGAAVLLAIGGYLFIQKPAMSASQSQVQGISTTAPVVQTADNSVSPVLTQTLNIDTGSFYYSVKNINAKVGDQVKVVLTAKDMMHNFNIDELGVHSDTVRAGDTTTIEFTANKAGTFEYYCSIGQHRLKGQVGTLTVTP